MPSSGRWSNPVEWDDGEPRWFAGFDLAQVSRYVSRPVALPAIGDVVKFERDGREIEGILLRIEQTASGQIEAVISTAKDLAASAALSYKDALGMMESFIDSPPRVPDLTSLAEQRLLARALAPADVRRITGV